MKNSEYNTLRVKTVCENKLRITFRDGGEFNGWFKLDGRKICRVTVPHGRKPIPPKTYKSMAKQLKLSVDDFDRLLDCPLKYDEYVALIEVQSATIN